MNIALVLWVAMPSVAAIATYGDRLETDEKLYEGECINSANARFSLCLTEGDLVVSDSCGVQVFNLNVHSTAVVISMQGSQFVLYADSDEKDSGSLLTALFDPWCGRWCDPGNSFSNCCHRSGQCSTGCETSPHTPGSFVTTPANARYLKLNDDSTWDIIKNSNGDIDASFGEATSWTECSAQPSAAPHAPLVPATTVTPTIRDLPIGDASDASNSLGTALISAICAAAALFYYVASGWCATTTEITSAKTRTLLKKFLAQAMVLMEMQGRRWASTHCGSSFAPRRRHSSPVKRAKGLPVAAAHKAAVSTTAKRKRNWKQEAGC